jgi:hypothetical protein
MKLPAEKTIFSTKKIYCKKVLAIKIKQIGLTENFKDTTNIYREI